MISYTYILNPTKHLIEKTGDKIRQAERRRSLVFVTYPLIDCFTCKKSSVVRTTIIGQLR